jgi:hypothetical protein
MSPIHKNSFTAWADLQKRAGLELHGRDEGFEEELKNHLAPSAGSLEEALRHVTTDDLVRAFFDVLQPFVAMFRVILEFFEKAGAAEGREQWDIMVDDVDVRLDHFRRFLKEWNSLPCEIEVPAVDFRGAWTLQDATRDMPEMREVHAGIDTKQPYWSGVADVDDWLRAYRARGGPYEEWPRSLAPSSLGAGYSDAAALALAALHTIRKGFASRRELIEAYQERRSAINRADALNTWTIAQNETDFWLGTFAARLARSQTLPPAAKQELGKQLEDGFARYPRKKFGTRIKIADLQSYLSLPIWQKRHELYAVWIATEIVNALPDHICEIHHEDNKIVFAFRETVVATVKSAWPPVRLISERRVPLAAPVGKGRSGNVQPDYGLWRNEASVDTCGLVVEVKHYKRSASSSFGHVLTDYSRAFPKAQVYLVNHGPIGDAVSNVPPELRARCHTIKDLTAPHVTARDELREAVRKYVGQPVVRPAGKPAAGKGAGGQADTVLAVDVSASMSGHLGKSDFFDIMREIVDRRCANAALIDVGVRAVVPLDKLPEAITSAHGASTSLDEPVRVLFGTFNRVLVITDDGGLNSLRQFPHQRIISKRSGLIAVEVLDPFAH